VSSKITSFLTIITLFLAFPFVYFYFLIKTNFLPLFSPQAIYPIIITLGLFLAFFVERKMREKTSEDTKHTIFVLAVTGISLYGLFLLFMTWYRYANFISEAIDVVYFHQTIWQLSEFKVPFIWTTDQILLPVWSQHFSPILIFLAPFFWISHSGGLLMMLQAIAVIIGVIPIYLIGKRIKSRMIGLAMGFAYLAFGGLQFGFAYGFHEIMFFPTLFLWMYYFYLKRDVKLYLLFLVLSLFVKEEVAFIVIFWSIYLLIIRREKVFGFITGGLGLLWYFLCFNIIFPYFNHGNDFGYWGQYDITYGTGILGLVKFILFKPLTFLTTLITPSLKIEMILETFGAFAFLLFLFPASIIIIFPSIMEKLLSSGIAQANGAHYSAAIAAVTIIATFEALPRIYEYKYIKKYVNNKNIFFATLIFYCAFFSTIFFGYRGYSIIPTTHDTFYEKGLTENNYQLLTKIISSIPEKATVSAQYQIAPHLNKYYKNIDTWPTMTGKEDFVIIDTEMYPVLGATSQDYNDAIDKLNKNNNYILTLNQSGILVYRNKSFTP